MSPTRTRATRVAGIVSFVYVVWYVLGLALLDRNAAAYNRFNRFYASIGARLVLAAVLLALVFHLFDGLRLTAEQFSDRMAGHELGMRATVRFLTFAVWIPGAVAVLWPSISSWFSR